MALLQWSDGFDFGCLEFDATGQMVGRHCFPGSPAWMPSKLFELYQDDRSDLWRIYPCDYGGWIKLFTRTMTGNWLPMEELPATILDDSLLRIDYDDRHCIKMIFHDRGRSCELSQPVGLWQSKLWLMGDVPSLSQLPTESLEDLSVLPDSDRLWAFRLVWIAEYLEEHTWAALLAIALVLSGVWFGSEGFAIREFGQTEGHAERN